MYWLWRNIQYCQGNSKTRELYRWLRTAARWRRWQTLGNFPRKKFVAKHNTHMLLILKQEYKIISVISEKKKWTCIFFLVPLSVSFLLHGLILGVLFYSENSRKKKEGPWQVSKICYCIFMELYSTFGLTVVEKSKHLHGRLLPEIPLQWDFLFSICASVLSLLDRGFRVRRKRTLFWCCSWTPEFRYCPWR